MNLGTSPCAAREPIFDGSNLEEARLAWKLLAGREGVERRYWAREDGKWVNKG